MFGSLPTGETIPDRPTGTGHTRGRLAAFAIAAATVADSADSSILGRACWGAAPVVNFCPEDAALMGPRAKLKRISNEAGEIRQIHTFAATGSEAQFPAQLRF